MLGCPSQIPNPATLAPHNGKREPIPPITVELLLPLTLPPPSLKRASKPPSLSCSSVPPSCSYCFSFESTVAQLCFIVAGAISVPPKLMGSSGLNPLKLSVAREVNVKIEVDSAVDVKLCSQDSNEFHTLAASVAAVLTHH
ncbi:hypothetical protein Ahy_A10g051334 [Arachis hypogaea]|uniref:Uncharacterized protein n=1 Tax=Arachis hypogaea TaxID=3818 RepID=A0A445BCF6_ARAHY|nr:hypothetical protein Ahy_A10g051334 [Arachis hypogaea]